MIIDQNLERTGDVISCRHCSGELGTAADPLAAAIVNQRPSTAAGPGVHVDPAAFTDRPITLRQSFCPECLTLLATEIVPADEPSYRKWSLT